jgi:hypothetical protein
VREVEKEKEKGRKYRKLSLYSYFFVVLELIEAHV